MSKRDASLLLQDMREAMRRIARYTAGMDFDAFLAAAKKHKKPVPAPRYRPAIYAMAG